MPCSTGNYTITTNNSHTPTWSGTLSIDSSGNATFTPTGGSGVSVVAQCGTENGVAWISFTNTSASPAVHYKKALWVTTANDYQGPCDNNRSGNPAGDTDDWTAAASPFPGPKPPKSPAKKPAKKAAKKPGKKVAKVAAKKAPAKKSAKKAPAKKAAKKTPKKAAKKKTAKSGTKKRR